MVCRQLRRGRVRGSRWHDIVSCIPEPRKGTASCVEEGRSRYWVYLQMEPAGGHLCKPSSNPPRRARVGVSSRKLFYNSTYQTAITHPPPARPLSTARGRHRNGTTQPHPHAHRHTHREREKMEKQPSNARNGRLLSIPRLRTGPSNAQREQKRNNIPKLQKKTNEQKKKKGIPHRSPTLADANP